MLFKKFKFDSLLLVFFIVAISLLFLVVYPFSVLFLKSFNVSLVGESFFTFNTYFEVFTDRFTLLALKNTTLISGAVTFFSLFVGGILAWLVTRTDFPYKRFVKNNVFLTFCIPPYILGLSYIEFFTRNGYFHRFLRIVFNLKKYTFSVYSLWSVVIVLSIHLYPLVFMAISNALSKTDNSLEDAAVITGVHRFKAVMTITIPMITPAIFSIGLFVFSRSMANFGATALLLPPTEETMTTRIYSSLSQLDTNTVAVMSIILVLFSGLVFLFQNILLGKKRYTIESSQTSSPRLTKLKKWKKPIAILIVFFQVLTTILPVLVLFISSFLKRWGLDLRLKNLTFQNYIDVFTNNTSLRAFRNSILYGLIAASISIVIGVTISYISSRTKFRGRKLIEFTASLPMSFPNTVMAISAIFAWNTVFFNLYNTAWIIIVTYVVLFLPLVLKNITGLMQNQDFSTEGAARIAGASRLKSFRDILLPAIIPGIKSAFIVCMLIALKEIPISLMLHTKGTETVGVLLFNLRSNSKSYESTSTIAIIVIVISIVGRYFIEKDRKKKGAINYEETGTGN